MDNLKNRTAVVVGAGVGGLSAAISLRAKGVEVTLLEQHATAGGKIRQTCIEGRTIDCGPTVFTMRWVFDDLFQSVGFKFDDFVKLQRSELLARHSWAGSDTLDLYSDVDRSCAEIEKFSGTQDSLNYRRFVDKSAKIFDTLHDSFMRAPRPNPIQLGLTAGIRNLAGTEPFSSLWNSLHRDFEDPRLRQLFARYSTYCGSSPFKAPATLKLIAHAERSGVWLFKGGMLTLSQALEKLATELGVNLRYDATVATINTKSGKIQGVTLADGSSVVADSVIFNGDTAALSKGLLGPSVSNCIRPNLEASLSAITHCQIARVTGFDLAHHTVLFGDDYKNEFASIFDHQSICSNPTVYICAQDRGPDATTPGHVEPSAAESQRERLFCLINAPAHEMPTQKVRLAEMTMMNALARHNIRFSEQSELRVTHSPNDIARRFPGTDGAVYGRPTHGWRGSFKRSGASTRVKGLFLAGGSVHPGAGVPMASLSGQLAAKSVYAYLFDK